LAEHIDGIDLTSSRVGDLLDLSQHDAEILVAEGWASAVPSERKGDHRRVRASVDERSTTHAAKHRK